ncbi:MAG: FAD-binding protein [Flavobacteriaceae bacterium]|nr:FAD-binding protein [Flavobacteriaceae bacterium]
MKKNLEQLNNKLSGDVKFDNLHRGMYATDASVYRKLPLGVAYPKTITDLKELISFATTNKTSLIPRTAGTSLAGQCVGDGLVVDVSKYFTEIISFDKDKKQITLQPGVVRDALNVYLKPFGVFFGPNTSTSNRCMIGGMVGNNSSGTTSIQYGVTRDKIVSMKTILSDGSEAEFKAISREVFQEKCSLGTLEGKLYEEIYKELSDEAAQNEIETEFPKPEIHRRNTGYAVDELLWSNTFGKRERDFNFCDLLSGSEGTLAFTTEITLQLDDLPPTEAVMLASHYNSIDDCLSDVVNTMKHNLYTCEMMDKIILDCTKNNAIQSKNRFFIEGDPAAILMLEIKAPTIEEAKEKAQLLIVDLEKVGLSYANPILIGKEINQALELRKAGLGLLGNMVGDRKAVACIEDTAVALPDLADFIADFSVLMDKYQQKAVYYAHAGAGEIHLRPILNLKEGEDVGLFRKITTEVAHLTKKYGGSFSGEHGDGIVRAEFLPIMIGEKNYQLCRRIKGLFDPNNIFNPGKIVDAPKMDESLRYEIDRKEPELKTLMDFSDSEGYLRLAEKCNGSGDCRKDVFAGGSMCPSYRATKDEKDVTRSRANTLREFLTNSDQKNKFNSKEIKESLDLCLSCKACASECPSNVDIAVMKSEFLYQYQKENGFSLRSKLFAYNTKMNKLASKVPAISNFVFSNPITAGLLKKMNGVAPERSLPLVSRSSLKILIKKDQKLSKPIKSIYLFVDEFTNYLDAQIAFDTYDLLTALNYKVLFVNHEESGRTFISKGFLEQAKEVATKNIASFKGKISGKTPLVGIEPSAILTFRDEYKRLVDDKEVVIEIAKNTFLIEEFLSSEIILGNISSEQFTKEPMALKIHNHCHQKALSNQKVTFDILNLPENYKPTIITSGCCGMAGSFGYEQEHYEVSMKVGEQTLFPSVRKAPKETIIVANGTSCRHQIKDGTQRVALHPVSVLLQALKA